MNTPNRTAIAATAVRHGGHFVSTHPVAAVARRACREQQHNGRRLVGGVACGSCWEAAIVADWHVMTAFDLPREQGPDDAIVDAIAVDRACSGERMPLNAGERAAAVAKLRGLGLSDNAIAQRLGTNGRRVRPRMENAA